MLTIEYLSTGIHFVLVLDLVLARYVQRIYFGVFFVCFFQNVCEFVIHCNKGHIFLCLLVLFAHYYW